MDQERTNSSELDGQAPYTTVAELRLPAWQRFIVDPHSDIGQLMDLFLHTTSGNYVDSVVPDSFAKHQVLRVVSPTAYERLDKWKGLHGPPFGGNYHTAELQADWPFFAEALSQKAEAGGPAQPREAEALRAALLKLNEVIMYGEDPDEFDWENYYPEGELPPQPRPPKNLAARLIGKLGIS